MVKAASLIRLLRCLLLLGLSCLRPVAAQQFNLQHLAQGTGLHNLGVQALAVDGSGDIWVATDGGLYHFDGTTFTLYDQSRGLPRDATQALAVSPRGRIYARSDEGIFEGDARHFEPLLTAAGPVQSDLYTPLLALSDHSLMYLRDNHLYQLDRAGAGHWREKAVFTPQAQATHPQLRAISSLMQAKDGSLWFGCGEGLCHLQGDEVETFEADAGVPAGEYDSLLQDRQGRLWARSMKHLVMREGGAAKFLVRDPPHALVGSATRLLLLSLDPQQRVITRTGQGLAILNGDQWLEYGPGNGLPEHDITQSLVDAQGNFWLGVLGNGLFRWTGYDNLESWTRQQGLLDDSAWNIVRDHEHRLLIGTNAGCRMLDEKTQQLVPCPWAGLPAEQTSSSAVDLQGNFWLAYQTHQLWQVPARGTKAVRIGSVPEKFTATNMLFDQPGLGYMSAWKAGLATLDTSTLAMSLKHPPGDARVDDITRATDGALWLATTGGLYVLRDGKFTLVPTLLNGQKIRPDTLTTGANGDIWASRVGSPIMHVTGAGTAHPQVEWQQTGNAGIDSVYSLRTDHRGWIWANAGNGVGIYDGHTWRRLSMDDGLVWSDTNQGAFYADDDGSVWVGTSAGLTHIKDPQRWLQQTSQPVALTISEARFGSADLLDTERPRFRWQPDTALEVAFSARAYERPPHTELHYRLLGLSSQWATTESFSIHIPTLPPGHYELQAVAVDSGHARTSATRRLAFDITPPWWQTGLFHAAEATAIAGAMVLVMLLLMQRQQRRFEEQEQKRREHERLLERATRDGLTGVWNRTTLMELLSGEMEIARRSNTPLAVALCDIDHFKNVNDTHGHAGGDEILRQFAQRLRGSFRQRDLIGRYGGEEFLVVMPGVPPEDRGCLMESVRQTIASLPFSFSGTELTVTISIGVAWMDSLDEPAAELIRRADRAMYEAKSGGRNCVMYHLDGNCSPASLAATTSKRYLQDLLDKLRGESLTG